MTKINDRMRRSLLYLYCTKAKDPLVCGKGNMMRQCEPIYNNDAIVMNGDLIELKQLANFLIHLEKLCFVEVREETPEVYRILFFR